MAYPRLVRSADQPHDALSERSDDELMTLARSGLRSAFATLVERHAERLVGLCARFVNDPQLGRELAQDTWVMVWQRREHYRAEGNFTGWLITVARNHCRNQSRRRKTELAFVHEPLPDGTSRTSEQLDGLIVEERRYRVRRALAELPDAMREALLLRYGEELSYDEMTPIIGAGESTLRSRVHHGLKKLKQKLEGES